MLVTTTEEFNSVITHLSNYDEWVIDCETNGLYALQGNQLCGVGVGVEGRTYYFPFRHQTLDSNLDSESTP